MDERLIDDLLVRWGGDTCKSIHNLLQIKEKFKERKFFLPDDFVVFYQHMNGSNDQDNTGFLFYSVDSLLTLGDKFDLVEDNPLSNIVIFADYMLGSWWYGVNVKDKNRYEIGIISDQNSFTVLTTSLEDFLRMYLRDDDLIYQYT